MPDVYVGTSGWSYPSWRPDFYPTGTDPKEFLRFYAERFRSMFREAGDNLTNLGTQVGERAEQVADWIRGRSGGGPEGS